MALSPADIERYQRHILLPEVGGQGQQKLKHAKVLIVGAGGLGCPILQYLTAAGVGTIGLCDGDVVELSNLQRQVLYTEEDIGKPKVNCAIRKMKHLNSETRFLPFAENITPTLAPHLIKSFDLVIEGIDSFSTRFMLNKACMDVKVPLLTSAIGRFEGQVALFTPWRKDQPCYQCLVPTAEDADGNCETDGVLGAVPGIIGSLAAMQAILWLTGLRTETNKVTIFDGLAGTMRQVTLPKDPGCRVCEGSHKDSSS